MANLKATIDYQSFLKVDIRVGTILEVLDFPKARKAAFKLKIDFGPLGVLNSSAQITDLYTKQDLLNRQITAVINFPEKQIANFYSQCLVLGVLDNRGVILLSNDKSVPNGSQIL